jgi:hypothetical protein
MGFSGVWVFYEAINNSIAEHLSFAHSFFPEQVLLQARYVLSVKIAPYD